MPAPLPLILRQKILKRVQQGREPTDIAFELRLAPRTVRRLCQQLRDHGEAALEPSYHAPVAPAPSAAMEQALFLHEQHPTWGAAYILTQLENLHPDLTFPNERTLQRRFQQAKHPPAPPGRRPASARRCANRPHEIWQMDAVEQCPLATGQKISWLRWVDEYSGAVLGTVVFPPPQRSAKFR